MLLSEIANRLYTIYKLGEPWKLPHASGFIVPILKDPPYPERRYRLLQEIQEKVSFRDSGSISGVDALNASGWNVFIRKGTMLQGKGTQSRATIHSIVLTPETSYVRIPVNCIHQSHGISKGTGFQAQGVAPHTVTSVLGEQGATWRNIAMYSAKISRQQVAESHIPRIQSDNLVQIERASDHVEDALKNIPGDHVNQVGVAVFNLQGVVAVEVFDNPESWRVFSESIIRSYRDALTDEAGALIEVRTDRAGEVLDKFLKKTADLQRVLLTENTSSKVWSLKGPKFEGELTEIEGDEVHLFLNSVQGDAFDAYTRGNEQILRSMSSIHTIISPMMDTGDAEEYLHRRGGYQILKRLEEEPLRFNELLEEVDVSRGTLSTRVKEAEAMGLVEKGIRKKNGSPAYVITEKGIKVKDRGEEKAR